MKVKRVLYGATALACVAGVWVSIASAHGGGLDSLGGHHDRKNGGYHFHRGPLTGQSFSSKVAAAAALERHRSDADRTRTAEPEPTRSASVPIPPVTRAEFEAMKRLLIQKGVFTEAQFKARLKIVEDEHARERARDWPSRP